MKLRSRYLSCGGEQGVEGRQRKPVAAQQNV